MRRHFRKSVATITCLLALSSSVQAMIAWVPLEDRIADSSLVVVGEIRAIENVGSLAAAPKMAPCTIEVARVLKGSADVKSVRLLWRKPTEEEMGIAREPPLLTYRVSQQQIWMLKKSGVAADAFTHVHPRLKEGPDQAELVAAVVGAMRNPEATLKNAKAKQRLRFSAAYSVLRKAVPENSRLTGHELLPADLMNLAVPAVIDFFTTEELHMQNVAYTVLYKIGLPLAELMPPQERVRGRPAEEARRAAAERRQAAAEAIRKWWAANSGKMNASRQEPTKPKAD